MRELFHGTFCEGIIFKFHPPEFVDDITHSTFCEGIIFKLHPHKHQKSKFYILAAGGIENSRLLLWSKYKNNNLFHKDLPIGNYYMDHPWYQPAEGFLNYNKFIEYFAKSGVSREFYIDCLPRVYLSPNKNFREKIKF